MRKQGFSKALISVALVAMVHESSSGQSPTAPPPRAEEIASTVRGGSGGRVNIQNLATTIGPRAVPRSQGTAAAGLKLTLDASASSGGRIWYRWIQTQGPNVNIVAADQVEASLIVPGDALTLGFVLVVGNSAGIDARSLTIEVESPEPTTEVAELKAVAGEGQTTIVGRKVILDGKSSEPRGQVRYRWLQVSGPRASIQSTAGSTCTFVPELAGSYQFALLVIGSTNLVSDPALVTVQVLAAKPGTEGQADTGSELAIDEFVRRGVGSIPGGSRSAAELAGGFDSVADRIETFKTYLEAASELSRRLETMLPPSAERRKEWAERFVQPWTGRMIERMRPTGIDLSQSEGQVKLLTKSQRGRLAEQLRLTAAGLRAASLIR